jgi:hypothetical protein
MVSGAYAARKVWQEVVACDDPEVICQSQEQATRSDA